MIADVLRLREKGWMLPRFRFAFLKPTRADFLLCDEQNHDLNRLVRIAKLRALSGEQDPGFPVLRDAQVVAVTHEVMTVVGYERITDVLLDRSFDYAQTWLVTPVSATGV